MQKFDIEIDTSEDNDINKSDIDKLVSSLDKNEASYDNLKNKHLNQDQWLKIIQLVVINIIFISVIVLSCLFGMKLVKISYINPYAVFVLGSFSTISVVSIYYICGGAIKAIFVYYGNDKDKSNMLGKFFNNSDNKE